MMFEFLFGRLFSGERLTKIGKGWVRQIALWGFAADFTILGGILVRGFLRLSFYYGPFKKRLLKNDQKQKAQLANTQAQQVAAQNANTKQPSSQTEEETTTQTQVQKNYQQSNKENTPPTPQNTLNPKSIQSYKPIISTPQPTPPVEPQTENLTLQKGTPTQTNKPSTSTPQPTKRQTPAPYVPATKKAPQTPAPQPTPSVEPQTENLTLQKGTPTQKGGGSKITGLLKKTLTNEMGK